mgnify:CR=1 FL=1
MRSFAFAYVEKYAPSKQQLKTYLLKKYMKLSASDSRKKDVNKLIDILKNLGVKISELQKGKYSFNAKNINLEYLNKGEFLNDAKSLRGL